MLHTDQEFKLMTNEDHHGSPTPLQTLDFSLVSGFGLYYMHLAVLGVKRKLLMYWLDGPIRRQDSDTSLNSRLLATSVALLSDTLIALSGCVPKEFFENPDLSQKSIAGRLQFWKATG